MANETVAEPQERLREHRENRKKNRGRKVQDNQARATAKFIRVPPRKARLVINEVRGRYAIEALAFLRFIPNRAAGYISKVLQSAVANAANNHGLEPENLKIVEARVDEGPRMKRVQPRAQGRAYRILKRMSHIIVTVEEVGPRPRKPRAAVGTRAEAARAARRTTAPKAANTSDKTDEIGAPIVETPVTPTAAAPTAQPTAEQTAPQAANVETTDGTVETSTLGEQVANTADTTDETGAPIEPDAK